MTVQLKHKCHIMHTTENQSLKSQFEVQGLETVIDVVQLQTLPFFGIVPTIMSEEGKILEGEAEGYLVRTATFIYLFIHLFIHSFIHSYSKLSVFDY